VAVAVAVAVVVGAWAQWSSCALLILPGEGADGPYKPKPSWLSKLSLLSIAIPCTLLILLDILRRPSIALPRLPRDMSNLSPATKVCTITKFVPTGIRMTNSREKQNSFKCCTVYELTIAKMCLLYETSIFHHTIAILSQIKSVKLLTPTQVDKMADNQAGINELKADIKAMFSSIDVHQGY
jgi:hypothetical protein